MGSTMQVPLHVGIIPDGNRRWARKAGVGLYEAYLRGLNVLLRVIDHLADRGVKYITVFAMSLDNCRRRSHPEQEVLRRVSTVAFERVKGNARVKEGRARILVLGDTRLMGEDIVGEAREVMEMSRWGDPFTVTILYCYSNEVELEKSSNGYLPPSILHLPGLDLVIRTGGYPRLSGFLPLRADYAELYSTQTLWPDLTIEEVDRALSWYSTLPKNYGR